MDLTIRDIAISFGYEVDKASEKKANDSIQSLKSTATKLLGAIGIGFSLVKLKNVAEEFNGINNKIRDATRGMGDQAEIQKTILDAANDSRIAYGDMADSVAKLASNSDVFDSVEDAANFATLMAKEFKAVGKDNAQVNSLMRSITTSMSKGVVDSSSMMALFKESPGTLRMMADSLGVTTEALQEMVSKGQISAKTLKEVFEKNADAIEGRFGEIDLSISDAFLNIRNQWGQFVSEMDSSLGITKTIAKTMVKAFNQVMKVLRKLQEGFMKLADRVGGVEKMMKLLAIVGGAIFAAMNAGKILGFLKVAGKLLGKINLKMMAIVAVIVLVALLIDDLIHFMRGDDSLMGDLFEKFGIDGDMVRETIQGIIEKAKELLPMLLDLAKDFGGDLLDALKELLPHLIEIGKQIIPVISNVIKTLLPIILDLAKNLGTFLIDALKELLPTLMDMAIQIIPMIIDVIQELLPFIVDIIEDILPDILGLIKDLTPLFMEIIEKVLPMITDLIKRLLPLVMDIIKSVLPPIVSLIKKLLPLVMKIINKVLPVIIDLIENYLEIVAQIYETVLPIIIDLIDKLLLIIMDLIDKVLPVVIELIEKLLPIVMDIIDAALPVLLDILEKLTPVIEFVADLLGNVLGEAIDGLMPIIDGLTTYLTGLIDFISGVFSGDWEKVWESVKQIFKGIIDTLVGIFKLPINLIIELINGFIGGLNKIKIPDWVPGFGGKGINIPLIPKLAKGTGFSPDTFIAGEEGPELVTGAQGRKVFTAAQTGDVFQTLKDIARMAFASRMPNPETVAATTSSVENKSVVQNNQFTNQFYGDRAGQQKSAEAMGKAAGDATAFLARGLAYAR